MWKHLSDINIIRYIKKKKRWRIQNLFIPHDLYYSIHRGSSTLISFNQQFVINSRRALNTMTKS